MAGEQAQGCHLVIRGRVQGVFFRQSAKEHADRLRLTGWIRNLPSGDVEALIEGDSNQVRDFISWCHRGPEHAEVASVDESLAPATGTFSNFSVIR